MRAYNGRLGDAARGHGRATTTGTTSAGPSTPSWPRHGRQGVGHVLWLTYRSQGPYVGVGGAYSATYRAFNAILWSKVREHPELVIADWDAYTVGQPSWFAADGIHISPTGAMALAGFIKAQLDAPRPAAVLRRCGWRRDAARRRAGRRPGRPGEVQPRGDPGAGHESRPG